MKIILFFIFVSITSLTRADEQARPTVEDVGSYICVPSGTTGFVFNKTSKTWDSVNFSVRDVRYLIRAWTLEDQDSMGVKPSRMNPEEVPYAIWEFGKERPIFQCDIEDLERVRNYWFHCSVSFRGEFTLNLRSNRYTITSDGTYTTANLEFRDADGNWNDVPKLQEDSGGDPPHVEIGTCVKF